MASWKYTLDIKEVWEKAQNNEITSVDLAKILIEKLKELHTTISLRFGPGSSVIIELEVLLVDLEDFIQCNEDDDDSFNEIFDRLYDWADMSLTPDRWPSKKLCWIKTLF